MLFTALRQGSWWSEPQWWGLIVNLLILIVTSIYAWFTVKLWKSANETFLLQKKTSEADFRPWIGIADQRITSDNKVFLHYYNFGKTLGYILQTSRKLYIGTEEVKSGNNQTQMILFPEHGVPSHWSDPCPMPQPPTGVFFRSIFLSFLG